MKDFTKIETTQVKTRKIVLTGKDIMEMLLSKGYISNSEYTKSDSGVFINIENSDLEYYIDNHGGLRIQIVTETKAEETI